MPEKNSSGSRPGDPTYAARDPAEAARIAGKSEQPRMGIANDAGV
jgi:hypothetical protein